MSELGLEENPFKKIFEEYSGGAIVELCLIAGKINKKEILRLLLFYLKKDIKDILKKIYGVLK